MLSSRSTTGVDGTAAFTYNLLGQMTRATDTSNGTFRGWRYDALGRKIGESSTNGGERMSQYDAAGRRTRLTWNDGLFVTYDYRMTGEMTAIREMGSANLVQFRYDDQGRRTRLERGNGTATDYGYDGVSRLTALSQDLGGTSRDTASTFGYTPASQISATTRSNDAYAYTNQANIDRPYTVNGLNQFTAAGATTFGYDGRGNLTSSGAANYTYNSRNLLNGFPGGSAYYDASDKLVALSSESTSFVYDGEEITAEESFGGATLRRYVYGPGADEPLVWYEGSNFNVRRWLHADERGSVVAVSDQSGNPIATNTYDEYGVPGANNQGRFQYTGQAWLPGLNMYYYKARIYSPTLGRFMQTDPIGYGDGLNWYNYVGGDPVNFTDPSGLSCESFKGTARGGCEAARGQSEAERRAEFAKALAFCLANPKSCITVTGPQYQPPYDASKDPRYYYLQPTPPLLTGAGPTGAGNGSPQKQTQCPAVPSGGPGAGQLNRNIQEASRQRRMNAGGSWSIFAVPALEGGTGAWFAGKVKTGGAWDYKNQGYSGGRNFGNFNYGATAAALGYDWATTMGAAHAYSLIDTGGLEGESAQIRAGFMYARRGCK